jgi:hypothetical protein
MLKWCINSAEVAMDNVIDKLVSYQTTDEQGFRLNNALLEILKIARKSLTPVAKRQLTTLIKNHVRVQRDGDVLVLSNIYDEIWDLFAWNLWILDKAITEYEA